MFVSLLVAFKTFIFQLHSYVILFQFDVNGFNPNFYYTLLIFQIKSQEMQSKSYFVHYKYCKHKYLSIL